MVRPLTPLMLVLVALTSCKFSLATHGRRNAPKVIPLQNDGEKFFYLVKEKKNWDDARKFCHDLGYEGDLAAFPSYGEWQKIEKQVWNHTATKLWIGGSCKKTDVCEDKDATVAWRWVTGEPIPINAHGNIQWKVNEPLVFNTYFKLLLFRIPGDNDIGSLYAGQASDKQWFICRKTGAESIVPSRFIVLNPFKGSSYVIYTKELDWASARAACADFGGQLASIESLAEWQHVFSEMKSKDSGNHHWLGASKAGPIVAGIANHEGFKQLTGGTVSKDDPAWYEYSDQGKCLLSLEMDLFGIDNNLVDEPCSNAWRSLCEFKRR